MKNQNTSIELTQSEVIAKLTKENRYDIDMLVADGYMTAQLDNLHLGLAFFLVK